MSALSECHEAARQMVGQVITHVRYVSLAYNFVDEHWDFGDWHWPEFGVEFETAAGESFYAIWNSIVMSFDLKVARGSISEELVDDPEHIHIQGMSDHPRWLGLVGSPITSTLIASFAVGSQGANAPVALRLETSTDCVWILAAEPKYGDGAPPTSLHAGDIDFEADEVIVVFGDERADALGLTRESISSGFTYRQY